MAAIEALMASGGSNVSSGRTRRSELGSSDSSDRRVFVGNMSWSTSEEALRDHMSSVGRVSRAEVIMRRDGKHSGGGIVEYANAADAARAIEELHDSELDGRMILVRQDREPADGRTRTVPAQGSPDASSSSGGARGGADGNRRVYVGNLPYSVGWQDLKDLFKTVGPVAHADVLSSGGRSKGCGIVEFVNAADAAKAIATMQDHDLHGRSIFVREDREAGKPAGGGGRGQSAGAPAGASSSVPGARVFVGNLPWSTSWQQLKDVVRSMGVEPGQVDIPVGNDGRPRGYGLVSTPSPAAAQRLVASLNGFALEGRLLSAKLDGAPSASPAAMPTPRGGMGMMGSAGAVTVGMGGAGTVRVTNLPPEFTWREAKDMVKALGVDPSRCRTDCAGGVATIRFDLPQDYQTILRSNGATVNGRIVSIMPN